MNPLTHNSHVPVDCTPNAEILTVNEAAALMRVSRATVYRLVTRGELPGRKVGRVWRFSKRALQAYFSEPTRQPDDSHSPAQAADG